MLRLPGREVTLVRVAALAGPETRFLGLSDRIHEGDVVTMRRSGGAADPAVDPGGPDRNHEGIDAVEPPPRHRVPAGVVELVLGRGRFQGVLHSGVCTLNAAVGRL